MTEVRNKKIFLFFFLMVEICSFGIGSEVSSPVVFALKVKQAVVIDGVLDEVCWSKSLKIDHFLDIYDNNKIASPQTFFQVVYDDIFIYFGITCLEPNITTVPRQPFERDSWPAGTSIEIFLDTTNSRTSYYQFATNPGAGIFDSYNRDTLWNGNWQIGTKVLNDRWTIEVAVPFSDFGIDSPDVGSVWGLNLCRNREGGVQYSSSWAPVGGDFHNPGKFNTLIFGGPGEWLKKEIESYRVLNQKFSLFLNDQPPDNENELKLKLGRTTVLMQDVSKVRITDKTDINRILAVYEQVQKIKGMCQDISDEIKVIESLNRVIEKK